MNPNLLRLSLAGKGKKSNDLKVNNNHGSLRSILLVDTRFTDMSVHQALNQDTVDTTELVPMHQTADHLLKQTSNGKML